MDFVRMREAETELSLEEAPTGALTVVRCYRPGVLVREATRCLVGGLISAAVLTALAGVLGREWAIVVGGVAVCGWTLGVIALVLIIGRGGPVSKVADLPSRWTGLPADAEAAVFRWAVLEQMIQEAEVGDGMRTLQQRTESEVDRKLAAGLVSEVAKVVPPSVTGVLSYQYGAWNAR